MEKDGDGSVFFTGSLVPIFTRIIQGESHDKRDRCIYFRKRFKPQKFDKNTFFRQITLPIFTNRTHSLSRQTETIVDQFKSFIHSL